MPEEENQLIQGLGAFSMWRDENGHVYENVHMGRFDTGRSGKFFLKQGTRRTVLFFIRRTKNNTVEAANY
ncbi:MAG: hypothetical protein ACREX0_08555 [Noviherbaspirillum sp.]